MFRLNTRLRSVQKELFEAFMPEFLDHGAQCNVERLREQGASRLGSLTNHHCCREFENPLRRYSAEASVMLR
jgi:hypothetical protein